MLLMTDILLKKQKGEALSKEEIEFVINGMVAEDIPDYSDISMAHGHLFSGNDKRRADSSHQDDD